MTLPGRMSLGVGTGTCCLLETTESDILENQVWLSSLLRSVCRSRIWHKSGSGISALYELELRVETTDEISLFVLSISLTGVEGGSNSRSGLSICLVCLGAGVKLLVEGYVFWMCSSCCLLTKLMLRRLGILSHSPVSLDCTQMLDPPTVVFSLATLSTQYQ